MAARKMETKVKMWDVEPHAELLSAVEPNEAFLACQIGEKYIIYFTDGRSVGLDLTDQHKQFTLQWIDIDSGAWGKANEIH